MLRFPRKLQAFARFVRERSPSQTWPCLVVLSLLGVGLWLRARGYFYDVIPFWLDEGSWALMLLEEPILEQLIRPVGFVAVSKAMAFAFGLRELTLRCLPWLSGLLVLVLAVPLSRRLFDGVAARVLFIAILALHPNAIDFAKEFKPYSVSLGLHVAAALAAASYAQRGSSRWLVLAIGLSGFGVLFAQDTLFVCPGVYLVLGYTAYRSRNRRHLLYAAVGATLSLGLVLALYILVWRHLDAGGGSDTSYWGKKYDVFYLEGRSDGTLWSWTLDKLSQLAAMPGTRRELWPVHQVLPEPLVVELQAIDAKLWLLLAALGLVTLVLRRRVVQLLLLGTPLLVFTALGMLGYWPYGYFRTNLFALFYSAAFAAAAFDQRFPSQAKSSRMFATVPALVLVVLPLLVFERDWHRFKESTITGNYPIREIFSTLLDLQGRRPADGERDPVIVDLAGCDLWQFYTRHHPDYVALARELEVRFQFQCSHKKRGTAFDHGERTLHRQDKTRVWFVLTRERDLERFPTKLPESLRVIGKRWVGAHDSTLIIGLRSL